MSYQAGKPIISDVEFDELKGKLRKKNSKVVQQARHLPKESNSSHQTLLGHLNKEAYKDVLWICTSVAWERGLLREGNGRGGYFSKW